MPDVLVVIQVNSKRDIPMWRRERDLRKVSCRTITSNVRIGHYIERQFLFRLWTDPLPIDLGVLIRLKPSNSRHVLVHVVPLWNGLYPLIASTVDYFEIRFGAFRPLGAFCLHDFALFDSELLQLGGVAPKRMILVKPKNIVVPCNSLSLNGFHVIAMRKSPQYFWR